MSSIAYDIETGTPYTMIKGVPHKLVTEYLEDDTGVTVTAKFVPAKTLPNNDRDTAIDECRKFASNYGKHRITQLEQSEEGK